jgi:hypothetical protein
VRLSVASRKSPSSARSAPRAENDPVARYAARLDRFLAQPGEGEAGALEAAIGEAKLAFVSSIVHQFAEDVRGQPQGDRQERIVVRGALLPPLF